MIIMSHAWPYDDLNSLVVYFCVSDPAWLNQLHCWSLHDPHAMFGMGPQQVTLSGQVWSPQFWLVAV